MLTGIGKSIQSWTLRDSFETCGDFNCALKKCRETVNAAPGYITIAGTKDDEGVVITRDQFGVANENWLNSTSGQWFVA